MVIKLGHPQCLLKKVPHLGDVSSASSVSSDNFSNSGYASSTPESQYDNSSTDGRCFSNISSASSHSLPYDDNNTSSITPVKACPDIYRSRPKLESWLAETRLESDQDTPAVVPATLRQHPRRTSHSDGTSAGRQRSPPALTRQEDRAEGFVALLVGKTSTRGPSD